MEKVVQSSDSARTAWRRSTYCSGDGNCVEVEFHGNAVGLRDSKDPAALALRFDRQEWAAFVAGVKAGEFDRVAG
jgi:Domain of unknown function (DUF397)